MPKLAGPLRPSRLLAVVPTRAVSALRAVWLLAVVWYELGVFVWSASVCRWPDAPLVKAGSPGPPPTHVLLVADPQVIDGRSYPGRSWWLSVLSQFAVDSNLRRSWSAVRRRFRPDVVVFLGDMMDNGRDASGDEEYQRYYDRFKSIFSTDPSTEVYYIAGNHDIGLGSSRVFSPHARKRYIAHFGPLNYQVSVANHTLVMLDAPGLVEEDYRRAKAGQSFENWPAPANGAISFVNNFASVGSEQPVVLFSHIPLFRPDTASCGPLRETGTIRRGVGYGYQNTLGGHTSDYILKYLRPSVIFSGDDHDYCEYVHSIPLVSEGPEPKIEYVREVTVKSISMAMGIRRPGFQLLSLASPSNLAPNQPSFADSPCLLPDQLAIYLNCYLPLFVISLVVLGVSSFRKFRTRRHRSGILDVTPPLSARSHPAFGYSEESAWEPRTPTGVSQAGEPSPQSSLMATCAYPALPDGTRPKRLPGPDVPRLELLKLLGLRREFPAALVRGFAAAPGMLSAAPSGFAALPARLRVSGHDDDYYNGGNEDDDDDVDLMAPTDDSNYFSLTSGRPGRRRPLAWAWTWTFVFRGRRRRVSVGVPPLLAEALCGRRARRGRVRTAGARPKCIWPTCLRRPGRRCLSMC
ncbi:Metallo-dependent phosphatase-like protein [Phellopilus nigrolimitatus]|nr:Metallo-dependent phosphatase-like protein [Phellopilus nigrolimitatus]